MTAGRTSTKARNAARKAVTWLYQQRVTSRGLGSGITIGESVVGLEAAHLAGDNLVGDHVRFSGDVKVGMATRIHPYCRLSGDITIGNYCQLASSAAVYSNDHPINHATTWSPRNILDGALDDNLILGRNRIGHGVWIGHGAIVLRGVTVGNGAVIGAGSVVTKEVPSYAIAIGNPAKVIRDRIPVEAQDLLEESLWWERAPRDLEPYLEAFGVDLATDLDRGVELLRKAIAVTAGDRPGPRRQPSAP